MFESFVVNVLAEAAKNPDIQKFVDDRVTNLKKGLLPDIVGTFPTLVAAAMKEFSIKLPGIPEITAPVAEIAKGVATHILDSDPDLPFISDYIDLSEMARKWLNL